MNNKQKKNKICRYMGSVTSSWYKFQKQSVYYAEVYDDYLQIVRDGSFDRISKRDQQTNRRVHLMDARRNFILHKVCRCLLQRDLTCIPVQ